MRFICIFFGYCIGCIQFAYILCKVFKNMDIRDYGSGNAGSTNVIRTIGFKLGFLVFLLDLCKAIFAFILMALVFNGSYFYMNGTNGLIPGLYAGLGVVLGHNFPFYMGFKGGKGIASSVGVIFCISILLSSVSYVIGLLVIYISRFVSLGAILILLSFLIMLLCLKYPLEVLFLDAMLTLLAIYQHRHNIRRLVKGQENKFIMNKK